MQRSIDTRWKREKNTITRKEHKANKQKYKETGE